MQLRLAAEGRTWLCLCLKGYINNIDVTRTFKVITNSVDTMRWMCNGAWCYQAHFKKRYAETQLIIIIIIIIIIIGLVLFDYEEGAVRGTIREFIQ